MKFGTQESATYLAYLRAVLRLRRAFVTNEAPSQSAVEELVAAKEAIAQLDRTVSRFKNISLTECERQILWAFVAAATDDRSRAIIASLCGGDPTLEFMRRLVHGDELGLVGLREVSPTGTLRRLSLIERSDGGGPDVHESRQTWAITRRALAWLYGDEQLDPELHRFVSLAEEAAELDTLALDPAAVGEAREAVKARGSVVIASGTPGLGRRSLLVAAAREAQIDLLEIDARRLAKDPAKLARQVQLIVRECELLARAPLVRNIDALVDDKDDSRVELVGTELAVNLNCTVFVTCGMQRPPMHWGRPLVLIELKPPTSTQRLPLWRTLLPGASEEDGNYLATQYPLAPAMMYEAARAALVRANGRPLGADDIDAGIRAVLDDRLGHFAKRVDVTQTWDDLVFERDQLQAIAELMARIRQRRTVYEQWGFGAKVGKGLGVTALFSGPPGTGKTMVAALIAKDLGLELYQVDMGKLVSKWIGETEKQLGELFDAAEAGNAILLFDEADSLFGKRTDVKSSNDRYANLETNYLLQRFETFTGICLLTSNHESNIDPAFQRRLSLHLRFEIPDEAERERLWQAMLPVDAPIEPGVDFAGLARRFHMTGGYIKNAALRAAFLAADARTPIGQIHLEYAARREYEGMGMIVAPHLAPSRRSAQ